MLMSGELSPTLARRARSIVSSSQRAASLTTQLLALSRKRSGAWPTVTAQQLVHDTLLLLRRVVPDVEIATRHTDESNAIRVDTSQIEQVMVNLVLHVRDALTPGDAIAIRTQRTRVEEGKEPHGALRVGEYVVISVGEVSALDDLESAHGAPNSRLPTEGGRTSAAWA